MNNEENINTSGSVIESVEGSQISHVVVTYVGGTIVTYSQPNIDPTKIPLTPLMPEGANVIEETATDAQVPAPVEEAPVVEALVDATVEAPVPAVETAPAE